uniref:Retrovirus-related Pol polyprotein from transposon TNT 1-94 n=1 Tax=Tanacetum cinerariifolium TaxID=118510 RepID=A0A6L2KGU5_TANCI|nr:retrovirus-related Pol polyprotein from transposon TNT 1-94 [Tanacetum cinerariifolium]
MFPEESDKIERYIGGLPDMIHESVVASKPKTMQEAIEMETELMDKKIRTFAERQTENKRKQDDNNNQAQQQPLKKQVPENVGCTLSRRYPLLLNFITQIRASSSRPSGSTCQSSSFSDLPRAVAYMEHSFYLLKPLSQFNNSFRAFEVKSYEDMYGGGCFDVSGSFKGFDCIEEHVGCDDASLPVKIKDEFENEVILDDVVSSPATLLMLLKRKVDCTMTHTTSINIDSNVDVAFTGRFLPSIGGKKVVNHAEYANSIHLVKDKLSLHTKQKVTCIKDVEDLQVRREKLEEIFSYLRNRKLNKKVILGTVDETSSNDDTSSNDEISSSEDLINYLSARDVEWKLPKNTQEEPPKPHYDPIKTEVEEPLPLDIMYPHSHVASSVMGTNRIDEFPAGDEMFLEIDKVVFKIHTKGYFEYDPLRVKTKISKRKKTSVIHDEGDYKKKSFVTGGRKGNEKVIKDEGICSKGNKADLTIYKRDMVNRKSKMVKDVGAVMRGKERGVVIEDGGFSNHGGKETLVTKRANGSRKIKGKSMKPEWSRFVTIVKQQHKLDEVSYHKLFDIMKQYQNEVNELRAKKLARNANPLALVATAQASQDQYYQTSRVKDSAYHKEKMLLCKQAEQGVPLQTEQYDWLADMDEEEVSTAESGTDSKPVEQVQNNVGYNVFANVLQHSEQSESVSNTCLVETDDSNVIPDLPDMKSTCFVRDLQGNDLLVGNRGSDLYIISLQESTSSTPLYLMAKATLTQSWLWHRRLSHLNFDYINLLLKKDIVIGLPKFKYDKDQLCSSCELSKAKRSSFKSKVVPSSKGRLNLLHVDLCGSMRVASLNRKKYILVIVEEYSRYTWTLFLRFKDETPEVLKDFSHDDTKKPSSLSDYCSY